MSSLPPELETVVRDVNGISINDDEWKYAVCRAVNVLADQVADLREAAAVAAVRSIAQSDEPSEQEQKEAYDEFERVRALEHPAVQAIFSEIREVAENLLEGEDSSTTNARYIIAALERGAATTSHNTLLHGETDPDDILILRLDGAVARGYMGEWVNDITYLGAVQKAIGVALKEQGLERPPGEAG